VEQYYQEAGRAGRDGKPADCILLWQKRDTALLAHFIDEILDPAEKERAWQRYHEVRRFAEAATCRHRQICLHFGETPKWSTCNACDVCGSQPEWLAAPTEPKRRRGPRVTLNPEIVARTQALEPDVSSPTSELKDYLRQWRRNIAKEMGVAAFIVMHDTSLEQICLRPPRTLADILGISGFGQRKVEMYGKQLLQALEEFRDGARATASTERKVAPAVETVRLLQEGRSFEDIAKLRGRQVSTIVTTVAALVESGELEFFPGWLVPEKLAQIEEACARFGMQALRPLKDALPESVTYDDIKLVVAKLRCEEASKVAPKTA
jgi:ATP-dependent DNA helicase RecQ